MGMNRLPGAARAVISHAAAFCLCAAALTAAPLMLLLLAAVISNDPGGPMLFPVAGGIAFLFALASCAVFLVFAAAFQILRLRLRIPWWVPGVSVAPLLFAGFIAFGRHRGWTMPLSVVAASAEASGFLLYWHALLVVDALLKSIQIRPPGAART